MSEDGFPISTPREFRAWCEGEKEDCATFDDAKHWLGEQLGTWPGAEDYGIRRLHGRADVRFYSPELAHGLTLGAESLYGLCCALCGGEAERPHPQHEALCIPCDDALSDTAPALFTPAGYVAALHPRRRPFIASLS